MDWEGIHEKICPLLVPVRTKSLQSFTREGRIELDIKKRELVGVARAEAERRLAEGKHEAALPAAQTFLRLGVDLFGPGAVELVPGYLLLADAHLGSGKLAAATAALAQAEWAVHRSPDCGHELKHRLHRSAGRTRAAAGNLQDALFSFANDVYHAAEAFGPDSTVCRYGYFLMANVFAKMGKTSIARSMYKEVAQTWHSHLTELLLPLLHHGSPPPSCNRAQRVDVDHMLRSMLELEQRQPVKDHGLMALLLHGLAMAWFMEGDCVKAKGFGQSALNTGHSGPSPELSHAIHRLLELVDRAPESRSLELVDPESRSLELVDPRTQRAADEEGCK